MRSTLSDTITAHLTEQLLLQSPRLLTHTVHVHSSLTLPASLHDTLQMICGVVGWPEPGDYGQGVSPSAKNMLQE
jgi:hypothetical protein